MNLCFLNTLDWYEITDSNLDYKRSRTVQHALRIHPISTEIIEFSPTALAIKANNEDTPRWHEAIYGPHANGFWKAMEDEITQLREKNAWDVVQRTPTMKVIAGTWAFRIKRYPDGLIKKFKTCFCVQGDLQDDNIDCFETYAPVVSWTTIRLLMILSIILNLATKQVDYVLAFVQAPINEDVYVGLPQGYDKLGFSPDTVLKLNRSLYGLKQSPKNFFQHLKGNLETCGFKQSHVDPCLFIHKRVICLTYVDDCLFYARTDEEIDRMLEQIKQTGMDLSVEDSVAGFLGVFVKKNEDGTITLTQTGLIERIIEVLDAEQANMKLTPAEYGTLPKDADGESHDKNFNYASVIGMMMYLAGNSRPDIAFAVHQCARFSHNPTKTHAKAVFRIGQYLKGTRDKGIILKPNDDLKIDCYVDADFAGRWNKLETHDPHSVRSRTGYIILVGNCPVFWHSKMQTEISVSTMESEYVALSTSMRDLLPLQELVVTLSKALHISKEKRSTIKSTIWEDNSAALILAKLDFPLMTPRSKHIAVKYHWFREHVDHDKVKIEKVNTLNQLADLFTKGLRTAQFRILRKQLMGW